MTRRSERRLGDAFTAVERRLLDLLLAGDDADAARAQLESASWGGYGFDDCDCFLIRVDHVRAARFRHDGGPFISADVEQDDESIGMLELWVVDGLLHSVDFMPWGDNHRELPAPERHRITVVEARAQKG